MSRSAGAVLEQLDRVFNRGTVAGLSEGKLLERFVTEGDEVAFTALNLIGPKVTKIAVFDRKEEVWYPFEFRQPVGMANAVVGPRVVYYSLGKYVYAFSIQTRGWSVLELPEGARPRFNLHDFQVSQASLTIECDDHIYTFHHETGKWDDLDTRAILDL